jgi:5-methyltetrahydropteroyltriglutamate--homocysteine methyltransferase
VIVPPHTFADYYKWAEFRVDATNEAIKDLPRERIRYHVCWGSWHGPHTNDVPAKDIMSLILKINAGAYSLEMATRHEHEWRVWEKIKLPDGKVLLPGLISHSTNVVEHPDLSRSASYGSLSSSGASGSSRRRIAVLPKGHLRGARIPRSSGRN